MAQWNDIKKVWEISDEEYQEFRQAEDWVNALEIAGVDNWEGYDYARELYQEWQE
jgi:hypothetical protein